MPRPITIAIVACVWLFVHLAVAKIFNDCELAQELLRQGFPEEQLEKWICIIEAESSMMTHVTGGPDQDGSYDYGLFQINDRFWCSAGSSPGKGCNVRCSVFDVMDLDGEGNIARLSILGTGVRKVYLPIEANLKDNNYEDCVPNTARFRLYANVLLSQPSPQPPHAFDRELRFIDLLSDDITVAARCAMQIYKQQGFSAWVGWNTKCKGRKLATLSC